MTTQVRHPIWFFAVGPAGARTFATLYGLESFARASISSVIPIQAYDILKNEQGVSILYTVVALLGLSVTLFMPMLIERFSRRWIYTAGVVSLALALSRQGELVADPEITLTGLPETDARGKPLQEVAYRAALEAFGSMPRAIRRDPDAVAESVRRAVRAALGAAWSKKPICHVLVLPVEPDGRPWR